jgi:hypothetical protein
MLGRLSIPAEKADISKKASRRNAFKAPFRVGEDFIFKTSLQRVDSDLDGGLHMVSAETPAKLSVTILDQRYVLMGGLYGKLRADQLRASVSHN